MGRINNIWYYLSRHKYLITVVIGAVLVGVVDENSVRSLVMLSMRLNENCRRMKSSLNATPYACTTLRPVLKVLRP